MSFKKKGSFGLFFTIFLTSFLLGVIFTLQLTNSSNRTMLKTEIKDSILGINKDLDLTKFWRVYSIIKNENFDTGNIKNEDLVDSAIKGLVDGLGDKHSEFYTEDENKSFSESLSGDFEGIGAVVEIHVLGVKIDRIIKGSPAKKFGLQSGDILIKANDIELEGLNLIDAVSHIKGKAGTKVVLEVLRTGEKNIITKEVIRQKIKIPSVNYEDFDNIGYISVNMFGDDTSLEFEKALESMRTKDGIIIDLRDNGGGYLISAVQILSNFIENGEELVITKYRDLLSNSAYKSLNEGELYNGKIVILINENSASASEITAGALSDYKKAILVGKKSYGKGSVQKPFELGDGSMVKITIAKWFTPSGKNIDKEGIEPDIEIDFEKEDFENKYDRQLEEAKIILNEFIKKDAYRLTIDKFNKEKDEK